MLTVFRVKSPVIVKRIVNTVFPRSAVMPCAFQFTSLLFSSCFPGGDCSEASKSLCPRYRQYPVPYGETPYHWAMAAALNLLRALPLNPSKMLPLFAIWAQRTSSPLYSQQTKRNSCRCPFSRISVPSVFQKILCIGFCENIKMGKTKGTNFLRLMPFPLLIHFSDNSCMYHSDNCFRTILTFFLSFIPSLSPNR